MQPVTIYSRPDCRKCDMTKDWCEYHRIPHVVMPFDESPDAQKLAALNSWKTLPIVVMADGTCWSGHDGMKLIGLLREKRNSLTEEAGIL